MVKSYGDIEQSLATATATATAAIVITKVTTKVRIKETLTTITARFIVVVMTLLLSVSGCVGHSPLSLTDQITDNRQQPFLTYQGDGPFDNYLAMNIDYPPVKQLLKQLEAGLGRPLTHRGEAHITVITPVEYQQILKPFVTMSQINQLAIQMNIQQSDFTIRCLGRATIQVAEQVYESYYLVLEAPQLVAIREHVRQLLITAGGSPNAFNPTHYFPHITVGFNPRDLHESDGVIKDSTSCYQQVTLRPDKNSRHSG